MSTDKHETPEGRAAKECAEASRDRIEGWTGAEVAVAAFGQAQQSQAALNGLVRILLHKGILSTTDLGDSMRWAYNERADQLREQNHKEVQGSAIILPPPPTARGN
jgi:hypothetical protein